MLNFSEWFKKKEESMTKEQYSLYYRIRKWVQPYWYPQPKKAKPKVEKSKSTRGKETDVIIKESKKPLTRAFDFEKQPNIGEIWTFHNARYHQIWCHLAPGSGFKYTSDQRSSEERKLLNMCIRPADYKGQVDRTHMLPFGYTGFENDERFLIGWSAEANQGPFKEFEEKQKRRKEPIYWMCSVENLVGRKGATWRYLIFNENLQLIDSLEHTMTNEFIWQDYREAAEEKGKRKKLRL